MCSEDEVISMTGGGINNVRNDRDLSSCISRPVFVRIDDRVGALYYGCVCLA